MALVSYGTTVYLPSSAIASYYKEVSGQKHVPFIRAQAGVTTYLLKEGWSIYTKREGPANLNTSLMTAAPYQGVQSSIGITSNPTVQYFRDFVTNKALERFSSKWKGDTAEYLVSVAQGQQSLDMVGKRLYQIYSAYRALRKGDLKLFERRLKIHKKTKKVRQKYPPKWWTRRHASSLWLEYWFGWTPLIQDIYTGLDVLQRETPDTRFSSSSKVNFSLDYTSGIGSPNYVIDKGEFSLRCKVGADIEVTNPNLLIANQLGLVNPATVLWDLVPFSFVLDWFINVNQVLGSLTEYTGVKVKNPWRIYSCRATGYYERRTTRPYWIDHADIHAFGLRREPGLPGVTLASRHVRGLSKTRALTASALVITLFAPKGQKRSV